MGAMRTVVVAVRPMVMVRKKCLRSRKKDTVYMCVCVCVNEYERERKRKREMREIEKEEDGRKRKA